MEIKYEDEDLGHLLLCSLPSFFTNFRDTILLSREELTVAEVYDDNILGKFQGRLKGKYEQYGAD
jgi:hypothetical protein